LSFLRTLLSRRDWVYLFSLLGPFVVYSLTLKASGATSLHIAPGLADIPDLMRSNLSFWLGYASFWIGLFAAVARSGLLCRAVVVLFHTATMLVVLVTTSERENLADERSEERRDRRATPGPPGVVDTYPRMTVAASQAGSLVVVASAPRHTSGVKVARRFGENDPENQRNPSPSREAVTPHGRAERSAGEGLPVSTLEVISELFVLRLRTWIEGW
jgi:hypothetical protein